MNLPLRLVFLGSDPIALPLLHWLAEGGASTAEVVAVFTQPDRPAGRGQKTEANEIKSWAEHRTLPVFQPEKISEDVRLQLNALNSDVALVMAYGHILREEFIATPRLGTLNLHTSLLPKYRGASPIQTAIANGEKETGVTLMRIVRKLDAGPVADCERLEIDALDTAADLETRLGAACVPLLQRTLPKLAAGTLEFQPQDESSATFCRKLQKTDGALDYSQPAPVLAARINGMFPWPGCTAQLGDQVVKLGLADALSGSAGEGEVVGADAAGVLVGTGSGLLRLWRLQRPGGKMLPASEFLRGFPLAQGIRIPSAPMTRLVTYPEGGAR